MRRMLGKIGELFGIGVVIVKLAALAAFVPFGVAPARRAQTVTEEAFDVGADVLGDRGPRRPAAAGDLRDGPAATGHTRILEHGYKALTLQVCRGLDAAQLR